MKNPKGDNKMSVEEYDVMDDIQQALAKAYFTLKEKQGEVSEEFMAYAKDMNEVWIKHIEANC